MLPRGFVLRTTTVAIGLLMATGLLWGDEPTTINPFGRLHTEREDARPGSIELSDGSIHRGRIYLTRDKRLRMYDATVQRQREIPLEAVKKIECTVKREWIEKEWKFKETTSDEKLYTGRGYPAREYVHTVTLNDGRTIAGPLSVIVYLDPQPYDRARPAENQSEPKTKHFVLNKRNKGELGQDLETLIYVKRITLGEEATKAGPGTGDKGRGEDAAEPPRSSTIGPSFGIEYSVFCSALLPRP